MGPSVKVWHLNNGTKKNENDKWNRGKQSIQTQYTQDVHIEPHIPSSHRTTNSMENSAQPGTGNQNSIRADHKRLDIWQRRWESNDSGESERVGLTNTDRDDVRRYEFTMFICQGDKVYAKR